MTAPTQDLEISGVTLIDGTGAPPCRATVAVAGGRIARVDRHGPVPSGPLGRTLTPGFIDIHTHADIALLARPDHAPKLLQGVTLEVFSNCGLGFCPCTSAEAMSTQREYLGGLFGDDTGVDWGWRSVAEYLARLRGRTAVHAAYLFPHGAVRVSVMGMAARHASTAELDAMIALAERSMEEGARGMSSGLWYAPMCYAAVEETVALCRIVARRGGIWAVHMRDYGDRMLEALEESIEIARRSGVALQVSHLQLNGPNARGRAGEVVAAIDHARAQGIDVTADSYPYTAGSTMLQALLPEWANAGGPSALRDRLRNASDRARMRDALDHSSEGTTDWSEVVLSGTTHPENAALEGRSVTDAAVDRGMSEGELVLHLLEAEDLRVCFIRHSQLESDLREFLEFPFQMVGSDGLHVTGKPHPRLWGTFPRVLAHYARDERLLSPEAAVRKMTGAPAERLGLTDRGIVREGAAADLVLLDWERLRDVATFDDPARPPDGIEAVWVAGTLAVRDGRALGERNGTVIE